MEIKNIIGISFLGAALLLLLPPIFLLGLKGPDELIGIIFQFLTGWLVLGLLSYSQICLYNKYQQWPRVLALSFMLLLLITGLDYLIDVVFPVFGSANPRAPWPNIPDSVIQNSILYILSIIYAYQAIQRKRHQENRLQLLELQKENLQLQLNSLQQQLNPHFFFNSLNTLSELIYIDIAKSEAYIQELSQVFRYILDMQQKPLVPLEEELRFLHSYFYLLKIRFEEKIKLECKIEQARLFKVPSLSLLVLLENVIKHNAISALRPVDIKIREAEGYLSLQNNKQPFKRSGAPSLGIGLENLNNRCLLLTKKACLIHDEEDYFMVKIPLLKNDAPNSH